MCIKEFYFCLLKCIGTVAESVVAAAGDSSVLSPPSNLQKRDKHPFCSTFRASITTEPSHLSFNQNKGGPTLRPRKIPVSIVEEAEEASIQYSTSDEVDSEYSESSSESDESEEGDGIGIQKCAWMKAHLLSCGICTNGNSDKWHELFILYINGFKSQIS